MVVTDVDLVRAGSLDELKQKGCLVVGAGGHTVAVYWHEDRAWAVHTRVPRVGSPLGGGTFVDGRLTCRWHNARFDLASGGTLDPFADDVRAFPVRVEGDDLLVDISPRPAEVGYWQRRLRDGMEQGLTLVVAKAVLALRAAG